MRVKPKPRTEEVQRIIGHTSQELMDRCPDARKVFPTSACTNIDCPWSIGSDAYKNCSFVAAEACSLVCSDERGLSLEEIGEAMNLTREGVRLIQVKAMRKFKLAFGSLAGEHDGQALRESHLATGGCRLPAGDEAAEPEDEDHLVLPRRRRKLG